MLARENNERMCLVEGDAPAGRMFRAIWLPALLSVQLGEAGGPPVRLRLLGEDLLAFRDGTGTPGIIDAFCAHRRAPLFFGRTEDDGLRCAYHGWVFDQSGQCREIPSDPRASALSPAMSPSRRRGASCWTSCARTRICRRFVAPSRMAARSAAGRSTAFATTPSCRISWMEENLV